MGGRFHGSAELDPMQDGPGYEENALGGIATPLEEDVPLECEFETEPAPTFDRADYDPVIQVDACGIVACYGIPEAVNNCLQE